MIKTLNSWKKVTIFLILSLPVSLVGQDSQFLSKTISTEAVRNSSSQPGDILLSYRFTGTRKILFLLIKYPGDASGIISNSQAQSHKNLLITHLERNAYDSLSVTIDITPLLEMPNPDTYYQASNVTMRIRSDAVLMAEQKGFDIDSYDREVIFSRGIWGSGAKGTMNKRTALMPHNLAYVSIHELGHTNGWRHTDFWEVKGGFPYPSNGTLIAYGDKFDLMGGSAGPTPPYTTNKYHHFNPWLKYRAGWLPEESILNVTNSGTYTIQALDSSPQTGGSVTKYTALKIKKDRYRDYWIFFRSLEELVNNGPVITEIYNDNIRTTRLLDMTPGSQNDDWKDAALAVGKTFSDTQNGITVKTVSRSSSEVQVEVVVDSNALANIDNVPVMDVINPLNGETVAGIVDYQVTAFDPDFGNTNGAGIDKVKLILHRGNDQVGAAIKQNLEPPFPLGTKEFTAPPYFWQFDTTPFNDGIHFIIIKTTSLDGAVHWVWFEHFIDNFAIPAAPSLAFPSDSSTNVSTNPDLDWDSSTGATSYRLQVSALSDFSTTVVDQSGLTSTSFQVPVLSNGTTYYWRVKAKNAVGISNWSPTWQFSTMATSSAPAAPALSSPSDNATDIATDTTLVWASSNGATLYQLQVSTVADFSTIELDQSGLTTTSFRLTGLSNSTVYFWRVKASNAGGESPWSTVRRFTTIVAAPAAPVLSSPGDNTIDVSTDTTLVWNSSTGAVSYGLQVSTTSDFSTTVVEQNELTETSFQVNDLENETTYFWHVNATNAGGTSPWSTVRKFTTEQVTSVETGSEIPSEFRLGQNYPNPFNPTTNITIDLPNSGYVSLKVYTLLGTEVATLVSENLPAGKYTIKFDASRLSSGLFFYRLQTSSFVETRKMLLVR